MPSEEARLNKTVARIRAELDRPFVRHVMTVATGTAAAQAISMAFAPLITRLYGPEAFGLQSLFLSIVALLATFAALSYPIAIVLPRSDADARGLVRLSLWVGVIMTALATLALLVGGEPLLRLLNATAIGDLIYLAPVAMFSAVLTSVQAQWLIRRQAYSLTARFSALNSLLTNSVKAGAGFLLPTAGVLIVTNTLAGLLGTVLLHLGWRRSHENMAQATLARPEPVADLRELAKRHADFPLLRTPQVLINAFSQHLPVLLLAVYFGAAAVGQYALAAAVLTVPVTLLGGAVMSVFYPRVTRAVQDGENVRRLIVRSTAALAAVGVLPLLVLVLAGPFLFMLVFGDQWHKAGVYAQWLAPWLFLQYLNRPAVAAVPALGLQQGLLAYELFSTGSKVLALWAGFYLFESDIMAVALFSISGIIAYIWLIGWVIARAKTMRTTESGQE